MSRQVSTTLSVLREAMHHGKGGLLKVFHGCALFSLRSLGVYLTQRPRNKLTATANALYLMCWNHHLPLSTGCPQGSEEPCWELIPISDNRKETAREGSFPESSCPQSAESLIVDKGKSLGLEWLNSHPGSSVYFHYDFGEG